MFKPKLTKILLKKRFITKILKTFDFCGKKKLNVSLGAVTWNHPYRFPFNHSFTYHHLLPY